MHIRTLIYDWSISRHFLSHRQSALSLPDYGRTSTLWQSGLVAASPLAQVIPTATSTFALPSRPKSSPNGKRQTFMRYLTAQRWPGNW